jgi:hypothetical protein
MKLKGLVRRYRPGFPDSVEDNGEKIEEEKQEFIAADEIRSTPLGKRKSKIVNNYLDRNIQFLNLDENPYVEKFEDFKITPGTIRTLADGPGWYRLIVAIDGSDDQACKNYKRGFERRINDFVSEGSEDTIAIGADKEEKFIRHEGLFFHDNVNGPENKTTVGLIFAEFQEYLLERGEIWSNELLNKALIIVEGRLYGKKLCRVKGHKDGIDEFTKDIEEALSNTPPTINDVSNVKHALRHPNGPMARVGDEIGAAVDGVVSILPEPLYSHANYRLLNTGKALVIAAKDLHETLPAASGLSGALFDLGRQIQGPFRR